MDYKERKFRAAICEGLMLQELEDLKATGNPYATLEMTENAAVRAKRLNKMAGKVYSTLGNRGLI